jgi:hypothetical protein
MSSVVSIVMVPHGEDYSWTRAHETKEAVAPLPEDTAPALDPLVKTSSNLSKKASKQEELRAESKVKP